jgi:dTDP-4-amino-4,6-dideoxygalactose transaminase
MVVTDDDEVAARIKLLRSHGMTSLTWDRHRGHASGYDVVELGFNYRIDEARAASRPRGSRGSTRTTTFGGPRPRPIEAV